MPPPVIPAKAGTHRSARESRWVSLRCRGWRGLLSARLSRAAKWVPAFAGMTMEGSGQPHIADVPPSTATACPVMNVFRRVAQPQHLARHLLHLGHATHGDAAHEVRLRARVAFREQHVLNHRGAREARAERVHADAAPGVFQRRGLGRADDAVLGGGVGRRERRADEAGERGDVQDRTRRARRSRTRRSWPLAGTSCRR